MKYFVNAPKKRKRKSRKRRTAAQNRATAKMLAANRARRRAASTRPKRRRTTKRSVPLAKRRRKRGGARRRASARRRSSTKRRSPVTRLRRNKVYVTNPRRRRRGYSRNPTIMKQTTQLLQDTGAVLAGSAASGVVSGFLPDLGNNFANAAKGVVVAVGLRMAAARFLGADTARFVAAGAMQVPLKNLVIGFLPADQQVRARALLGDYGDLGAYAGVLAPGGDYAEDMGAYSQEFIQS